MALFAHKLHRILRDVALDNIKMASGAGAEEHASHSMDGNEKGSTAPSATPRTAEAKSILAHVPTIAETRLDAIIREENLGGTHADVTWLFLK